MTEKNIAEKIREDHRPGGEMFTLSGEARRLRNSLAVAQKWLAVAEDEDKAGHLTSTAEYTRDQLEEELSRIAFRMEVLERRREMREARPVEDLDGTARASVLSDALLTVYCLLRDVPDGAFGGDTPERSRYAHMGALMAAQDAANAELERCVGEQSA
jgi:PHD/YefM family antitoxin component YafN of YafNO toxin-antitoxin module